ncbi:PIN domain-containing protein [Micromonospora sp. NPDC000089]|uniref:PIN domain-containing protein n=1 Tax=unclassified Micromonospora TaxID=2617518 RepID=UPI0036B00932
MLAGPTYATELQDFLASREGMPMATSSVGFVETVRTLDRIGDYPDAMQMLVRNITEILLTEEVRDSAAALPAGIRTLAALHVASAQVLGDALDVLVTYDKRMSDIAASVGLPVEAPGAD